MKKILVLMLIASVSAVMFAGTPVKQTDLPKAAQTFISKYFANDQVKKIEKDNGFRGTEYDVDFVSGAEVEFKEDGSWKEITAARGTTVPTAIIPEAIVKYVSGNFKGQSIVEISQKRGGYEVELSNGIELKLTKDAKPMSARNGKGSRQRH